MKSIFVILAVLLLAVGCSVENASGQDQCLRSQIFQHCLINAPAGPVSTEYNDWSEVVQACEAAAYRQSWRKIPQIKPECLR